jgi:segregation and condensation protein B
VTADELENRTESPSEPKQAEILSEPDTPSEAESDIEESVTFVADLTGSEASASDEQQQFDVDRAQLKAIIEAVIYITDEPLTALQIASATGRPLEQVKEILDELAADYAKPDRGLTVREVAGGYKMATKPEHHESVRAFVKNLKPPLKLSLAALETLAVIAYKQPVTAPEIMDIRGVQGVGVMKTLIDRKLIATAGRKNVVGKPILYKTTREFMVQFGLKDLSELPTLKEFEELGRLALTESEPQDAAETAAAEQSPQPPPEGPRDEPQPEPPEPEDSTGQNA